MPSLESYKYETITKLKRRELQSLCKRYQIKANSKSALLIEKLQRKWKEIHEITDYDENNRKENIFDASNLSNNLSLNASNLSFQSIAETDQDPESEPEQEQLLDDKHEASQNIVDILSNDSRSQPVYDDGANYNANPNGNNGSFVEIEDDSAYVGAMELEQSLNNNSPHQTFTTHNNFNNGSMIVVNKTPSSNNGSMIAVNKTSSPSLDNSLSLTPKLDQCVQDFIRRSLNPESAEGEQATRTPDKQEGGSEDIQMSSTPLSELKRMIPQSTPMLSVPASRVTVESDDVHMEDVGAPAAKSPTRSPCESSPDWKQTPLKALQILNSLKDEISMEPSFKSEEGSEENKSVDDLQLEISFESSSKFDDKNSAEPIDNIRNEITFEGSRSCEIDNSPAKELSEQLHQTSISMVDNLFYESPIPKRGNISQHIVEPKSEVTQDKNVRKISMTFGDGQVFAFKSVYSPSRSVSKHDANHNHKRRKSTSMLNTSSPETLCEKTMAIRKMMEEEENECGLEQKQKAADVKEPINKKTAAPKTAAPDWNSIHDKQIFSRQPDLSQWDKQRKQRTEKLFGASGAKLSTPSYRQRSKSMVGRMANVKSGQSEKKANKKRALAPSTNDHLFNHNKDKKLNKKVIRNPTPYKRNTYDPNNKEKTIKNRRASQKPRFSALTESISEEKVMKVPKEKLAFDPDKVKSRLFQATSASSKKQKIVKKAQTPQVKSTTKNKIIGDKFKHLSKNWSEIKSKIDTNNNKNNNNPKKPNVSGVKRKLSWSVNKHQNEMRQPRQKKRRLTDMSLVKKWK